jgi:uncharacterized protein YoxC
MNELTLFDYASLPINDAMELNAIKERIKVRLKRTAEDIIEIGKDLIIAKEKCGHGGFEKWISFEFEMNIRTAQNFMNVADKFSDKNEIISFLKPTALYMLSAPSTPETVREAVIEKIESGEKVDLKEIERLKKEAADLLASKNALQSDLMKKVEQIDEANRKISFQNLTVESITKQNDDLRNLIDVKVSQGISEARAALIQENHDAIAQVERDRDNAKHELGRIKRDQEKAIKDGVTRELHSLQSDIDQKRYQLEQHEKDIESLKKTKLELDAEVGLLAIHKESIKNIKENLSFISAHLDESFYTRDIPPEVLNDWQSIHYAVSQIKRQLGNWFDQKSPIESEALMDGLVDLESILENVDEAYA